ncbi:MAG TPA: hypothetical protein VJ998_06520 [Pseudomonadales bacterium]|nr:hypothetical protein [Pseudomonadales bacterium]
MAYNFTAFMKDPDAPRPENPIHSTDGGKAHGFKGALIGGIHVYGWTCTAFMDLLGEAWLDRGWVEAAFRKPTYDGDRMAVSTDNEVFTVSNQAGETCIEGHFGLGRAPWFGDLSVTPWQAGLPAAENPPRLTLATAPAGKDLLPMTVSLSAAEHEAFVNDTLADDNPLYHGEHARCHPSWLAGRLIYLLHHSFDYGPAIHTRSHIQHLAPAAAVQVFTVTGHCRDAFERKGHHYIVNDGSIWSEDRTELVRLRHTAIFRLRSAASQPRA